GQRAGQFPNCGSVGAAPHRGGVGPAPVTGASTSCQPTDLSCHYFDPTAFAAVPAGQIRFGTVGRNSVRGPGFFNLDASTFRGFRITERVKFQIRAEMFGATNTPHYNTPGLDVTNPAVRSDHFDLEYGRARHGSRWRTADLL